MKNQDRKLEPLLWSTPLSLSLWHLRKMGLIPGDRQVQGQWEGSAASPREWEELCCEIEKQEAWEAWEG